MRNVTFVKRRGFKWDDGSAEASFPVSELAQRCVGKYLDLLGSTEGNEYSIPSKTLQDEILRLSADDDATQEDYDAFNDKVSSYADTLSEQELIDWYTDLNDSNTIVSVDVEEDYTLTQLPDTPAPHTGVLQRRWTVLNANGRGGWCRILPPRLFVRITRKPLHFLMRMARWLTTLRIPTLLRDHPHCRGEHVLANRTIISCFRPL